MHVHAHNFISITRLWLRSSDRVSSSTIESRDYAPPLCMLGLGESGEGAYTRDSYISV